MKVLWNIKWENILTIVLLIAMTFGWIAFLMVANVYTLAIAVIQTFMELMVIIGYESLKNFRQDVVKNWK